jgi:hypothetical protein
MGKLLLIMSLLFLFGCSSLLPTVRSWPAAPADLKQVCPELKETAQDTTKLSEVIKVVTENYATYHECRIKMNAWIEWYDSQKLIFERVK